MNGKVTAKEQFFHEVMRKRACAKCTASWISVRSGVIFADEMISWFGATDR
jgi:hypothetical protein